MITLGSLIVSVLNIYIFVVVAAVVLHWLMYFRVINTGNQFVQMVDHFLFSATEPVYRRLRRILPRIGQIDISPIAVLLLIFLTQGLIQEYWIYPLLRRG